MITSKAMLRQEQGTVSFIPDSCEVAASKENGSESLYTETKSSPPGASKCISKTEEELLALSATAEKTVAFWG